MKENIKLIIFYKLNKYIFLIFIYINRPFIYTYIIIVLKKPNPGLHTNNKSVYLCKLKIGNFYLCNFRNIYLSIKNKHNIYYKNVTYIYLIILL